MVERFFSVKYANRSDLFEGLFIWQSEEYRQIQGTYPVISLSFARVKDNNYQNTRDKICEIIRKLYVEHIYIRDSEKLTHVDKAFYDRMLGEEWKNMLPVLGLQRKRCLQHWMNVD